MKKVRLDQLVFEKGLTESRERAKTSIMSGLVFVNGQRMDKPGMSVDENAQIELKGNAVPYVSRGGLKLEKALKIFGFDPTGLVCIDCGASTGGFTDVLLKNGAKKVFAVDVGYGQLAWSLRCDERVVNMERTNIRYVTTEMLGEQPDLAVMDVRRHTVRHREERLLHDIWNVAQVSVEKAVAGSCGACAVFAGGAHREDADRALETALGRAMTERLVEQGGSGGDDEDRRRDGEQADGGESLAAEQDSPGEFQVMEYFHFASGLRPPGGRRRGGRCAACARPSANRE